MTTLREADAALKAIKSLQGNDVSAEWRHQRFQRQLSEHRRALAGFVSLRKQLVLATADHAGYGERSRAGAFSA